MSKDIARTPQISGWSFFPRRFSTVWDSRVWMARVTWFVSWMPRPGRNAFLCWWGPMWPQVARVVGINGGSQQGQRQSVIRVEAWWQRRTSTSTIRYKNKEAVVVVVVQKNEYEYDMIQVETRQWQRRWHTIMCLTSVTDTEKNKEWPLAV